MSSSIQSLTKVHNIKNSRLSPSEERQMLLDLMGNVLFLLRSGEKREHKLSPSIDAFFNFGKNVLKENSLFAVHTLHKAREHGLLYIMYIGRASWTDWSERYQNISIEDLEGVEFHYEEFDLK